jgi:PAS domain S-box-containing protein
MESIRTKKSPSQFFVSHLSGQPENCEDQALARQDAIDVNAACRDILDTVNDGIYKIDTRGFFIYLNSTALRRTGLSPEHYRNCHYLDLIAPEDQRYVRERFENVMRGEENPLYNVSIAGRDGKEYVVEVKSKPIFENGRVVGMLGISRDVTIRRHAESMVLNAKAMLERMVEQRTQELAKKSTRLEQEIEQRKIIAEKLRESEDRYRAIFENTGTAMMIVDENMMINLVNAEFEKMSGYTRREVEGNLRWTEFLSHDGIRQGTRRQNGREGQDAFPASQFECQAVDKYGQIRDVIAAMAEIPATTERIVSLLDITERKRALELIRKREEDLKAKTIELEELNTALKVLLKNREEDRRELEERVSSNLRVLVLPYLERLKKNAHGVKEKSRIHVIESNLKVITSPFARKLTSRLLNLTPKEIEVANFIKEGRTTKEIAEIMGVSKSAIDTHRHHIRKKMGLKNKKMNMRSYLHSLN